MAYGVKRKRSVTPGGYVKTYAAKRRQTTSASMYPVRKRPAAYQNMRTAGALDVEKKWFDTSRTGLALVAPTGAEGGECDPPTVACLNAMQQGDGPSNRDGNQVLLESVEVKGNITCAAQADQTGGDRAPEIFIALVLDKQTNGTQLDSENVYTNPSASAFCATDPLRNLLFRKRFEVLAVERFCMPVQTLTYDGTNIEQSGTTRSFQFFKKLALKVNFGIGTNAEIANVVDNSIHVIAYCNSTAIAPTINYNARVRFIG